MYVFNRVFNRYDIYLPMQVNLIYDRRERGRLAGTGGAGHKNKAIMRTGKTPDRLGIDMEIGEGGNFQRNEPARGGNRVSLLINILADARDSVDGKREVHLAVSGELSALLGGHLLMGQLERG